MSKKKVVITENMFQIWRNDPVTEMIFNGIKNLRSQIEKGLTNEEIILSSEGQLKLARLLGQREGLDLVLNIHYEEITDGDE